MSSKSIVLFFGGGGGGGGGGGAGLLAAGTQVLFLLRDCQFTWRDDRGRSNTRRIRLKVGLSQLCMLTLFSLHISGCTCPHYQDLPGTRNFQLKGRRFQVLASCKLPAFARKILLLGTNHTKMVAGRLGANHSKKDHNFVKLYNELIIEKIMLKDSY